MRKFIILAILIIYAENVSTNLNVKERLRDLNTADNTNSQMTISSTSAVVTSEAPVNVNTMNTATLEGLNTFYSNCNQTIPNNTNDCTSMKNDGYWCCHQDYIVSSKSSFCVAYTDKEAKLNVITKSQYYSYTCKSTFIRLCAHLLVLIMLMNN